MTQRLGVFALLAGAAIGGAGLVHGAPQLGETQPSEHHGAWVAEVLKRMESIKPGMTREALLKVFTTEGGLTFIAEGGISTGNQRTFVSRDCRYFKIDVSFQGVGRSSRDANGRVTRAEDSHDIIVTISKPYLQFPIMD